jgi:hypothetical protein
MSKNGAKQIRATNKLRGLPTKASRAVEFHYARHHANESGLKELNSATAAAAKSRLRAEDSFAPAKKLLYQKD